MLIDRIKYYMHLAATKPSSVFGTKGAGCLVVASSTGRFLLGRRSHYVSEPGTWGIWGGKLEPNEQPLQAAKREMAEELGHKLDCDILPLLVFKNSRIEYHNYLAVVESEFVPVLDVETADYTWINPGDWPQPLHFGVKSLLDDPHSLSVMRKYSKF